MEQRKCKIVNILSWCGLAVCIIFAVVLWKKGLLTSNEQIQTVVAETGIWGMLIFLAIQIVQVVVPIIPGGVSCFAGVLMFGAWKGFLLNDMGICIGSILAFGISRRIAHAAVFLFSF